MRVSLSADINWESKVDHAIRVVDLKSHFEERDYGHGLSALILVLNCRDPALGHKQRIRHSKGTNTLYVDVMLNLPFFVQATHIERRNEIFKTVRLQLELVFTKRKIENFDSMQFVSDLLAALDEQLNGPLSTRLDANCLERANAG